jgi:Zn-dependent protease with chaperone function
MPIHFTCTSCGTEYDLKEEYAGKKVRCKTCQATLVVPEAAALAGARSPSAGGQGYHAPHEPGSPAYSRPSTAGGAVRSPKPVPIRACISTEERKKRLGVTVLNTLVWLFLGFLVFATFGVILAFYAFGWLVNQLLAEYNVRKLQALGTEATEGQFPEIARALAESCATLGVRDRPKVIIVNDSHINAFAIKFARKKVIVLLSETLEGVIDRPEELRFFLGHELAHVVIDHGARGVFERYKPAAYKAAREMTCDNCGCAAAGDLGASKVALKRLAVGNHLFPRLSDDYLYAEARYIYSGLTGWLLKQYLTYPPLGKRLSNVEVFSRGVLEV